VPSEQQEELTTSLHEAIMQKEDINRKTFPIAPLISHAAREDDDQSEIESYRLIKSRRDKGTNIYTEHKMSMPLSSIPFSQVSQISSSSKGKRKKGLSLAKSNGHLPI
jgi:hypothetical protein